MNGRRFPLFVDLTGHSAVVVGGGAVGLRRAGVLARFGAVVTVVSPRLSGPAEGFRHLPRPYRTGDLEGAFLAVAAADDPAVNAAVGREARRLGVLFNRADCPAECGFIFPAVCEGSGLVAGLIGTEGDHRKTVRGAQAVRRALRELDEKEKNGSEDRNDSADGGGAAAGGGVFHRE